MGYDMSRCSELESDIVDLKEIIELQVYECIAMQLSLNELELKIEQLVDDYV